MGVWLEGTEPTLFELSVRGRRGVDLPPLDVPEAPLPEGLVRSDLPLPELGEVEVVRHFTRLSQRNYSVDTGFYPLGSCTMKYNPKVHEQVANLPGFAFLHPYQDESEVQGILQLMYELQTYLGEIAGFDAVSLQPAAGAHGELTGILIARAYQWDRGERQRTKVVVPDSSHGTNPATASMVGLRVVTIPSDERGNVDLEALRREADETLCAFMLTNPNTLGLFEERLEEVARIVHEAGGLMYGDGANLNALLGVARPGELGFDILHFNLHKTFSTPHGGGGPGSGPVGVKAFLADFLPAPVAVKEGERYRLVRPPKTIGRVKAFYGHVGVWIRAYAYIRRLGPAGLRRVAEDAVLNANYLLARVRDVLPPAYDRPCMHEFVSTADPLMKAYGVRALDVAKRLIDYGFHPPTIYFPLIVHEALMIEPTETETKATLDAFAEALHAIAREAAEDPELLKTAPHRTPVRRLDEARASHPKTMDLADLGR